MNQESGNSRDLLNDALREVSGDSTSAASKATAHAKPQRAPTITDAMPDRVDAGGTATDNASSPTWRWKAFAVALLLLIAASAYWWTAQHPTATSPSAVLQSLAGSVEDYRAQHAGKLPESLAPLATFPKGAVDWPQRYWKARDAAGRTEIIWVPQPGGHYRIMLRKGSEVWTVTDRNPPAPLTLKGNP